MSLNLALNSALSGLLTAQKGLDLISHNISNVNTEGYSRKSFSAESRVLGGIGAGVQTGAITRQVESGLVRDLQQAQGLYHNLNTRQTYMERIQDLFGSPEDNSSLSHVVNGLAEQFEILSIETSNSSQTDAVVQSGVQVVTKLNTLSQQIQDLRGDADKAIQSYVDQINGILGNIDAINDKITLANATQGGSADLEDKRDLELNKLSQLIDITWYQRESGAVSVFTKSGTTLVDSEPQTVSHVGLTTVNAWDTHASGDIEGIMVGGIDITEELRSGKLKGLIDIRDGELVNLQAQIDELAQQMMQAVNQTHNRGTSFPTSASTFEGSRTFIRSAEQTFSIDDADADSAIVLFNSDGSQKAKTTLRELMATDFSDTAVYSEGGPEASAASSGPWTLQDYAAHLQAWMRNNGLTSAAVGFGDTDPTTYTVNTSATASLTANTITDAGQFTGITAGMTVTLNGATYQVTAADDDSITLDSAPPSFTAGDTIVAGNANGKMNVALNDSRFGLSFRDQTSGVAGDDVADLPISFDSDGDGDTDESFQGLSNFLGLNDFFHSGEENWLWETKIQSSGYSQLGATTLTFMTAENSYNLSVSPGSTLEDIANRINQDPALQSTFSISASVVKEGTGERLRIRNESGEELVITGSNGTPFDNLGLARAATGQSKAIEVNSLLAEQPDRLSKGRAQFDETTGEYYLSAGDNSIALDLSATMTSPQSFDRAGGLLTGKLSFSDYAATILSGAASRTNAVEVELTYQKGLTQSLELKSSEISSVNLDEELAQLMAFEQSYAAAAKVISTTQSMFDILNGIIK
jgi:flagellar hook-associated protein 1 FlgK